MVDVQNSHCLGGVKLQTKARLQVARCDVTPARGPSVAVAAQSDSLQRRGECLCQRMPESLATRGADLFIYKCVYLQRVAANSHKSITRMTIAYIYIYFNCFTYTTNTYIHAYIHTYIQINIYIYVYVYWYINMCVWLYMCIHVNSLFGWVHMSNNWFCGHTGAASRKTLAGCDAAAWPSGWCQASRPPQGDRWPLTTQWFRDGHREPRGKKDQNIPKPIYYKLRRDQNIPKPKPI